MSHDRPDSAVRSSLTRRDLFGFAARGAASVVVSQSALACTGRGAAATDTAAATASDTTPALGATPSCVLTAALTEGPFFVDEHLLRSDIRPDPSTGTVVAGVPLALRFDVQRVDGRACAPLTGAYLDVWHADPSGAYSDVSALGPPPGGGPPFGHRPGGPPPDLPPGMPPGPPPGAGPPPNDRPRDSVAGAPSRDGNPRTGTAGRKFLRGYQITDARGQARFASVYPGWYQGRAVHIHFKLRLFAGATQTYEFTSQCFFDEALTDAVHARGPYATRGTRDTRNATDGIYNSLAAAEQAALTLRTSRDANGYAGVITLGVRVG